MDKRTYKCPSLHVKMIAMLNSRICVHSCSHLVALHRAFPVEADHMRQAFTAAAAAPHGGHVVVKERTVICRNDTRYWSCFLKRPVNRIPAYL